jgi:hypothetical protein
MPLLEEIKNVLTFAAFRPDPDDANIPWNKRFVKSRSLLLNVSRTQTSWRSINKRGRYQDAGSEDGDLPEAARQHAEEWRGMVDSGWCAVSLNNRFIISLENNLSRRENQAELLRLNPKAVLGAKCDRGKRYAIYHHPATTSSLLMACDDAFVKIAEDTLRGSNLRAGRICCGLFAMMEAKLNEIYALGKPEAQGSFMLVALCEGSIAALVQQNGQWTDLRCRSGVGMDSADAMFQIVSPLAQKIQPGTPVLFLHDGIHKNFAAEMLQQFQQNGQEDVQDISVEDQLWNTISNN